MEEIRWNPLKNERLKKTRDISFEEILQSELVKTGVHPKRKNQFILYFFHRNYIWLVPFVKSDEYIFLKTLYPSRQHTRLYMERGEIL